MRTPMASLGSRKPPTITFSPARPARDRSASGTVKNATPSPSSSVNPCRIVAGAGAGTTVPGGTPPGCGAPPGGGGGTDCCGAGGTGCCWYGGGGGGGGGGGTACCSYPGGGCCAFPRAGTETSATIATITHADPAVMKPSRGAKPTTGTSAEHAASAGGPIAAGRFRAVVLEPDGRVGTKDF